MGEATLDSIAQSIKSIEEHLRKMNGRVGKVEQDTRKNEKDIAVLSTRCQLVTHYTDEDLSQMLRRQESTEQKLWDWIKSNGTQLVTIVLLIIALIQLAG